MAKLPFISVNLSCKRVWLRGRIKGHVREPVNQRSGGPTFFLHLLLVIWLIINRPDTQKNNSYLLSVLLFTKSDHRISDTPCVWFELKHGEDLAKGWSSTLDMDPYRYFIFNQKSVLILGVLQVACAGLCVVCGFMDAAFRKDTPLSTTRAPVWGGLVRNIPFLIAC